MDCSSIQEKLSAYMEGILLPKERILIDDHLKTCQNCSEFFADLKKTVEYVKNLKEIEAPPWLTQKIMTRVRAEVQPKKGIIHWLFYPLHVKLPIEAVAAVFIAVITIYIFKGMQPEMEFPKTPTKESPQIFLKERDKIPSVSETKPAQVKPEELLPSAKGVESMDKFADVPKTPAPLAKQDKGIPSAGALPEDEAKWRELMVEPKARILATGEKEIIRFTVTVGDLQTATKEIERAFAVLNGRLIKKESFVDKHIITAMLNSKKITELSEKLRDIGEFEEKTADFDTLQGEVEITIEVLKYQCSSQHPSCPSR